jgi:ABC-type uncharacterized transport system involved in gliding motility auxiliary subunit
LVIHPQNISERAQFAIDQYVLNGGKLVAFLDPFYGFSAGPMGGFGPSESSSTLNKLLPAWGLYFDDQHVLADMDSPFRRDPRGSEVWPTWVELPRKSHSQSEIVTQDLGTVSVLHAGAFTGKAADKGLEQVDLFSTSTNAMRLITKTSAGTATNATAVLPLPRPEAMPPADANATALPDTALKVVRKDTLPVVVLVGDVDLLNDQLAAQPMRDAFGQHLGFRNSNFTFVINLVDYLTGDDDLIRVRSQSQRDRPLELLDRKLEKATRRVQKDIDLLQKELDKADKKVQEVKDKLNEQIRQLLAAGGGQLQVSQADIKKLEDSQADEEAAQDKARTTIREKKRELREEINALKFRIKWANILIMPALVAIFGLFVAIARHRRTTA